MPAEVPSKAQWRKFTTKMKWVLFGTLASVIGAAGAESQEVFADQPWAVFIPVVVPFLLGYIPNEKTA